MFTEHAGALPPKKRSFRGRRLVIVDIENVVEGAVMTLQQAAEARACVAEAIRLEPTDHVVIGTSHVGVLSVGLGWTGNPRIVARSGENGADLALLDVLTDERVSERFDDVVIVSGDGVFADCAAGLGAAGVAVTVASRREACSTRLRVSAARTVYLNLRPMELEVVA
jgi:hypothetical protein